MTDGFTAFISPGSGELILIMLALILLFGAKDAPRILRSIQAIFDKIQRTAADFRYQIMYGDLGSGRGTTPTPSTDEPDFDEGEDDTDWIDAEEDDGLRDGGDDGLRDEGDDVIEEDEPLKTEQDSGSGATAQRSAGP